VSLLIKGGTVVSPTGTVPADVLVEGEKISALAAPGSETAVAWGAAAGQVIDADGLYVLPGGIDVHTHMEMPFGGTFSVDTFETGTRAAAWGGTTTIVDFAVQAKGSSLLATLDKWHAKADGHCVIDYGFHMIVSDVNDTSLKEMEACIGAGVNSFKMFMAYPGVFYATDGEILRAMTRAADTGAVIMMHAENGIAIDELAAQALAAGKTDPVQHGLTRPPELEAEATHRAISHAEIVGVPIMIVHVSGKEAMEQVRWAQQRGLPVHAETCPQYITLTADDMKGLNMDFTGAKYVCSPPPRDKENQQAIWDGITSGVFQTFSSDHCPFRYDDPQGKQMPKGRTSFRWVPNGIPGIETRLPILFSEGVSKGRISLQKFVELTSTNHARIYGLYPRKGSIGVGFDADIVLWDAKLKTTIRQADMRHGADYTPWEGFETTGWPVMTIARGRVVADHGRIVGEKGAGDILSRGKSSLV